MGGLIKPSNWKHKLKLMKCNESFEIFTYLFNVMQPAFSLWPPVCIDDDRNKRAKQKKKNNQNLIGLLIILGFFPSSLSCIVL